MFWPLLKFLLSLRVLIKATKTFLHHAYILAVKLGILNKTA